MTNTQIEKYNELKLSIYKRAFNADVAGFEAALKNYTHEMSHQYTICEVLEEIIEEAGLTAEYETYSDFLRDSI